MRRIIAGILVLCVVMGIGTTAFAEPMYSLQKMGNMYLRSDGVVFADYYSGGVQCAQYVEQGVEHIFWELVPECRFFYKDRQKFNEILKKNITMIVDENGYRMDIEIPVFARAFGDNGLQTEDGTVFIIQIYSNGIFLEKRGVFPEIVKAQDRYALDANNNLYNFSTRTYKKISENVKDFKVWSNEICFRTTDNDLYFADYTSNRELLMSNCSEFYFGSGWDDSTLFAKTNDGKWYHKGNNGDHQLQAPQMVDGNDITPTTFNKMVEAKDYVYCWFDTNDLKLAWENDGNIYLENKLENKKELLYEDIIYVNGDSAYNAYGDVIDFNKNRRGEFYDYNIADVLSMLRCDELYGPYVNTDGGLSYLRFYDNPGRDNDYRAVEYVNLGEYYPDRSDWAEPELKAADEIGFIDSVKFIPMQNPIKREEFCNMIVDFCEKLLGEELSTTQNPFSDTENEKVMKAYANGIIAGVSATEFAPDRLITREQMCAILTRTAKMINPNIQFGEGIAFHDMKDVSDWAVEGINAMSALGIVKGDGVSITPQANTSVEQAVAMSYRLSKVLR